MLRWIVQAASGRTDPLNYRQPLFKYADPVEVDVPALRSRLDGLASDPFIVLSGKSREGETPRRACVADGTITKNVGRGIAVPKNEDDKASIKKAWSAAQSATFLLTSARATSTRCGGSCSPRVCAPARRRDSNGPTVDLAKGEARIERTLSVLRGVGFHAGPPKTSASSRPVAFDRRTGGVLHVHRKAQLQARLAWEWSWCDDFGDLVFRRPNGEPIHPNRLRSALASACKSAGVPRLTPHGLRHSFATAALIAGVHVKKGGTPAAQATPPAGYAWDANTLAICTAARHAWSEANSMTSSTDETKAAELAVAHTTAGTSREPEFVLKDLTAYGNHCDLGNGSTEGTAQAINLDLPALVHACKGANA